MEKKYKVKLITGFRDDQYYTIDIDEAHKAYYLFLHPEERAVFANGVALIGKNIQGIESDYNAILEYNPSYKLTADDFNELRLKGIDRKVRELLTQAKNVSYKMDQQPQLGRMTLAEAIKKTDCALLKN